MSISKTRKPKTSSEAASSVFLRRFENCRSPSSTLFADLQAPLPHTVQFTSSKRGRPGRAGSADAGSANQSLQLPHVKSDARDYHAVNRSCVNLQETEK